MEIYFNNYLLPAYTSSNYRIINICQNIFNIKMEFMIMNDENRSIPITQAVNMKKFYESIQQHVDKTEDKRSQWQIVHIRKL